MSASSRFSTAKQVSLLMDYAGPRRRMFLVLSRVLAR